MHPVNLQEVWLNPHTSPHTILQPIVNNLFFTRFSKSPAAQPLKAPHQHLDPVVICVYELHKSVMLFQMPPRCAFGPLAAPTRSPENMTLNSYLLVSLASLPVRMGFQSESDTGVKVGGSQTMHWGSDFNEPCVPNQTHFSEQSIYGDVSSVWKQLKPQCQEVLTLVVTSASLLVTSALLVDVYTVRSSLELTCCHSGLNM